jgi:hypothetical protein
MLAKSDVEATSTVSQCNLRFTNGMILVKKKRSSGAIVCGT